MSNTTHLAANRLGGRVGCADGRVRISVTLSEEAFRALRDCAAANAHSLSGEAAQIISDAFPKKETA